ncbi:MAG: phosphatidate cytidylyltransferase [candidate division KSB1 bacterium]|nr:phosphatidate cytidylyltransferase [candidate division KSB1 bacterium]
MNWKSFGVRTAVAVVYGPLMLASVWFGGLLLFTLIGIVALLCYWEYVKLVERKQAFAQLLPGLSASAIAVSLIYFRPDLLPIYLVLAPTIFFFVEIYRRRGSPLVNLATTLFGSFYYPLFLGSFLAVRRLGSDFNFDPYAPATWLILVLVVTWVCDTAAYMVGANWGKHKLIERVSPNKTIEGAIAGFLLGILTAYICHITFVRLITLSDSLVIGAVVSGVGQYGDLFESLLKRDAGVKDSSNLIPGHGGFLDRFDSLTTVTPLVYLYLRYFAL